MKLIEPNTALLDRVNGDAELQGLTVESLGARYEEISARFHSHFTVDQAHQHENALFHKIRYLELLSRPWRGRILDVGNDKPFLTYFLRALNPDASFNVISNEIPESPFPLHEVDIEIEAFPFEEGTFDGVIFTEVVEHLWRNPSWCVAEMNRVLKQGATAFVTTPNACDRHSLVCILWQANLNQRSGYYATLESGHLHLWTVELLSNLFKAHGFTITAAETKNLYGHTKPDANIEEFIARISPYAALMNEAIVIEATKSSPIAAAVYPPEIFPDQRPVQFQGAIVGFAERAMRKD